MQARLSVLGAQSIFALLIPQPPFPLYMLHKYVKNPTSSRQRGRGSTILHIIYTERETMGRRKKLFFSVGFFCVWNGKGHKCCSYTKNNSPNHRRIHNENATAPTPNFGKKNKRFFWHFPNAKCGVGSGVAVAQENSGGREIIYGGNLVFAAKKCYESTVFFFRFGSVMNV